MKEQTQTPIQVPPIPSIIPTSHNLVSGLVEFYAQLLRTMAEERESQLRMCSEGITQLKERNAKLVDGAKIISDHRDELQKQCDAFRQGEVKNQNDNVKLLKMVNASESQVTTLQNENEGWKRAVVDLRQQLHEKEESIEAWKQAHDVLRIEFNSSRKAKAK